jgi:hypothetical protein
MADQPGASSGTVIAFHCDGTFGIHIESDEAGPTTRACFASLDQSYLPRRIRQSYAAPPRKFT